MREGRVGVEEKFREMAKCGCMGLPGEGAGRSTKCSLRDTIGIMVGPNRAGLVPAKVGICVSRGR